MIPKHNEPGIKTDNIQKTRGLPFLGGGNPLGEFETSNFRF